MRLTENEIRGRSQLLREVRSAAIRSFRSRPNPETDPLWAQSAKEKIPSEIVIATSSYRKAVTIMIQLAAENGVTFAPHLQEITEDDALLLMNELKRFFFNGNGASQEDMLLGHLGGVPVWARASKGEQNYIIDSESITEAAVAKAQWLFDPANEPTRSAAPKPTERLSTRPISVPASENKVVVGVDTMEIVNGKPLGKPYTWAQENGLDVKVPGFKREYLERFYPEGATYQGSTAVVALDALTRKVADECTEIIDTISQELVLAAAHIADETAAGAGIYQYIRREKPRLPDLAKILGVPLPVITRVVLRGAEAPLNQEVKAPQLLVQ